MLPLLLPSSPLPIFLAWLFSSLSLVSATNSTSNFTISNGQIYTPGFAIIDAPQPGTPEGGDQLEVALDVSCNGKLPLPEQLASDSPSQIHNITIFLYSFETGNNFTINNGSSTAASGNNDNNNVSTAEIMRQEPGSTVKHVRWTWPSCLVGDGDGDKSTKDRGVYNISIHQNFRLNGTDYYTVFDLPISVTNSIPASDKRLDCELLKNELSLSNSSSNEVNNSVGILFAPGDSTQVQVKNDSSSKGGGASGLAGMSRAALWVLVVVGAVASLL